ncbi:MAG: 4-(cytidine 5'-diphospho)-2-C-methyl-D-erythritol kinase [Burkholderiaceae bacterium]|nr:4-(cytidine 5'-diphospho)-2-C-methyl-D-erythritol kinase [Burkholderiaceae bacterium]
MLYDVPAPAKVNLFLHVVGRRADGYHLLQTAFQFIDMQDTLHFERRTDGRIDREFDLHGITPSDDLTLRAARALQQATGVHDGVQIALHKTIPAGGGLGGGSSDAASTLIALNRLWGCGLSREALMQIGLSLGADVPVFVFGQSAFAEGVGERLTALDLPVTGFMVAQPQVSVPTPEIFRASDLTRDTFPVKITDFLAHLGLSAKNAGPKQLGATFGRNDLEIVACRLYPEVGQALETMRDAVNRAQARDASEHGFDAVVRMSGSGACVYAQCSNLEQAARVEQEIMATMHGAAESSTAQKFRLVRACPSLIEHPLRHWIAD